MKRDEDIIALFLVNEDYLKQIKEKYSQSLMNKDIDPQLKVKIKNYLENLRSILDYLAKEIKEKYVLTQDKPYFPMACKNKDDFIKYANKQFPNLISKNKLLFDTLESYQSYNPNGLKSLNKFNSLVNEKKHDNLTPQEIKEMGRSLSLQFPNGASIGLGLGSSISGNGIIESGGAKVILNNEPISGNSPAKNISGNVSQKVTIWKNIKFSSIDEDVLPFLELVKSDVSYIASDLKKYL